MTDKLFSLVSWTIFILTAMSAYLSGYNSEMAHLKMFNDLIVDLTALGLEGSQQQWFYRNQLLDDRDTLERAGIIRSSSIEVRPLPDLTPSSFHPSAPAELSAEALRNRSSREV